MQTGGVTATAPRKPLTPQDYQGLLIKCLNEETKKAYVAGGKDGLEIEEFVSFLADRMYLYADSSTRGWLDMPDHYSDLKAFLFVVFRSIDVDDDGSATWHEFVEYLIDERISATESVEGAEQRWALTHAVSYSSEARLELDAMSKIRGATSGVVELPRSSLKNLPVLPAMFVNYLDPCSLLLFSTRRSATLLHPTTYRVVGTIPETSSGMSSAAIAERDGTSTDTLVSCHRDGAVRCWAMKDSLSSDQKIFEMEFIYEGNVQQTAATASKAKRGTFFVGGQDGSMMHFEFDKELLQDYRRGDVRGFNRIVKQRWLPGENHSTWVSAMTFLEGMPHLLTSVGRDGICCLRDVDSMSTQSLRKLHHPKGLLTVATSKSCPTLICTAGFDMTIAVWDVMSHSHLPSAVLRDYKDPHLAAVVGLAAPNSSPVVMSIDAMTKMKLWDLRMGRCLQTVTVEPDPDFGQALSRAERMQLPTSMTMCKSNGRLFVGSKSFHRFDVAMLSASESCYHSDIVAVAFCERTMHIMTVHLDAVVLWGAETGCIVGTHKYAPVPIDQLKGEPEEEETIRAFLLSPTGVNYVIGSSRGRVTRHKQRSGEVILDTGRVHNCEVRLLVFGAPSNDSDFVLSIGLDGSIHVTSKSMRLPLKLPQPFSVPSTSCVFAPGAQQLFCGGETKCIAVIDPYTMSAKGILSRLVIPEAVTAMTVIEGLAMLLAIDTTGLGIIWGLKPHAKAGFEIARFTATEGLGSSITHLSCSPLLSTSGDGAVLVFAGDERGRVSCWKVVAERTGGAHVELRWRIACHDARVGALEYITLARRVVSIGLDQTGFVLDDDGTVVGQLCHGRGSEHAVWKGGAPPKYSFPDVSSAFASEKARSLRVIRIIQKFIRALKRQAERSRLIRKTSLPKQSFIKKRSTMIMNQNVNNAGPRETPEDYDGIDEVTETENDSAMGSEAGRADLSATAVDEPFWARRGSGPSDEDSVHDAVRKPIVPKARVMLNAHGMSSSSCLTVAVAPQPPFAASGGATPIKAAPRRYRSSSINQIGKEMSPTAPAAGSPGSPSAAQKKLKGFIPSTATTKERIDAHVGQLAVLAASKYKECSPRTTLSVMDSQYREQANRQRRMRELTEVELKFRHAVTADDQKKYARVSAEVQQMQDDDAKAAERKQQERERALRGPPAPPSMVSRRPATAAVRRM